MSLDAPCSTCDRPMGDHLVREWAACTGTFEAGYEPTEMTPFTLDGRDLVMADQLDARALVAMGAPVPLPVALLTFSQSFSDEGGKRRRQVAEVALVATPEIMRAMGRLVRDTCNGAANKAGG